MKIIEGPEAYLRAFQLVVVGPECVGALQKECAGMGVEYYWMSAEAPCVKATQVICDASQVMTFALTCGSGQAGQEAQVDYADLDDVKQLVEKIQKQYKLFYKLKDYVDGQYRIVPGENGAVAYQKDGNSGFSAQFNIIGVGSNQLTVQTDYLSTLTKNFVCFNKFKAISELLNPSTGIAINLNNVFVCTDK